MSNLSLTRDQIQNRTHDFLPYYHVALQPSPTDPLKTFVRDCVTVNPPGKSSPRNEHQVGAILKEGALTWNLTAFH